MPAQQMLPGPPPGAPGANGPAPGGWGPGQPGTAAAVPDNGMYSGMLLPPPDTSGYYSDPTNPYNMGYSGGYNVTPPSAYQNPAQLAAIGQMEGAYANMFGSQQAANASMFGSQAGLQGSLANSAANQAIAQTQASAAKQAALDQLLGTQSTNTANQAIAQTNVGPQYGALDLKSQLLSKLFGTGTGSSGGLLGGLLGGANGTGGGLAGAGGVGAGGTSGGVGGGTAGAGGVGTPPGQPAVAQSQPMNALQLQQNLGAGQAAIDQNYADLRNNLLQQNAARGGGGPLNQGLEAQIAQRQNQDVQGNNLNWENFASQLNNQNNLAYNSQNLGQFNANQNRALQSFLGQLGLLLPYTAIQPGQILSSGLAAAG